MQLNLSEAAALTKAQAELTEARAENDTSRRTSLERALAAGTAVRIDDNPEVVHLRQKCAEMEQTINLRNAAPVTITTTPGRTKVCPRAFTPPVATNGAAVGTCPVVS